MIDEAKWIWPYFFIYLFVVAVREKNAFNTADCSLSVSHKEAPQYQNMENILPVQSEGVNMLLQFIISTFIYTQSLSVSNQFL